MNDSFTRALTQGNESYHQGELTKAANCYRTAIRIRSDSVDANFNLGVVLRETEQWQPAITQFQQVLDLSPGSARAQLELGIVFDRLELYEVAEWHYRKAITKDFDEVNAHFNLSLLLLRLGRYTEGFAEYDWRWSRDDFVPIQSDQPRWDGQPLAGTLLVHTEQGAGDMMQFARFLPVAAQRCQRVRFVCPENLHCLFKTVDGVDEILPPKDVSGIDAHIPIMSLPMVLGTTLETIPNEFPYFRPEPRDVRCEALEDANGLRVGICWAGSPTYHDDRHRSCRLAEFQPLFDLPGIDWFSLQMGAPAKQINELKKQPKNLTDLCTYQNDFADTAAIMEKLDLVIAVDTSVLHLSASLRKPTWGLMSKQSDWRWMPKRLDSPWYPTVRLFRQIETDNWPELFSRVAIALKELTNR